MKIGVRAHDFGRHSAAELARIISGFSFNAAHLAATKAIEGVDSYLSLTDEKRDGIAREFSAAGIEISVLGCYIEPALPAQGSRFAQLEIFFAALKLARAIGAKFVGTETTRFERGREDREMAYNLLRDSVLRMMDAAEREGAFVAIEPVQSHTLNTPELTARLIREVDSPRLSIIFDPINLLVPERVESQDSLWRECLDSFGEKVVAIHVKDARIGATGFEPCALGHGMMDYTEIMAGLARLGKDVPLLREEIRIESAAEDRAFLERLASGI